MAGAAGGLAGGLATVGANLQSGFEAVSERVNLVDQIENADLVITGEGEVNESSLTEKLWRGAQVIKAHVNSFTYYRWKY